MREMSRLFIAISIIYLILICSISAEISNAEVGNNLEALNVPDQNSTTSARDEQSGNLSEPSPNSKDLELANIALQNRVVALERRLEAVETLLTSLDNDVQFYHPTSEVQFVDMEVVHWDEAVKNSLRNVAIPFQTGYVTGAISSWEFSLARENDAVTVNLLLIEERYNRRALFAGFTAYVLSSEGNVFSQANALPVNFLDGSGHNLHLPNVISLNEITNSSNGLLSDDDMFKMRFRLELLGVGHKLYAGLPMHPQSPAKDVQTVIFDVANLLEKLEERKAGNNETSLQQPLAYTKFTLSHDVWNVDTSWSAEIFENDKFDSLAFHVILEQCEWTKLFASFYMEIWDFQNKKQIHTQAIPVNDFMKDRITIDPLLTVSQLTEDGNKLPKTLQFKLQFIVYGKNARYYTDVI